MLWSCCPARRSPRLVGNRRCPGGVTSIRMPARTCRTSRTLSTEASRWPSAIWTATAQSKSGTYNSDYWLRPVSAHSIHIAPPSAVSPLRPKTALRPYPPGREAFAIGRTTRSRVYRVRARIRLLNSPDRIPEARCREGCPLRCSGRVSNIANEKKRQA